MLDVGRAECVIWWADPDAAHPRLISLLSPAERGKWARLAADRRRPYLAAHALARIATGRLLDIPPGRVRFTAACQRCGGAGHGKPRIEGSRLDLSITRRLGRVGVAVTRGIPVGLDVEGEAARRVTSSLTRGVLNEQERATFALLPEDRRWSGLLRYWTRKEAVLKAVGHGLAVQPGAVAVSGPDEPPCLLAWPAGLPATTAVHLHDAHPGAGHLGAVACVGKRLPVTEHDASALLAG